MLLLKPSANRRSIKAYSIQKCSESPTRRTLKISDHQTSELSNTWSLRHQICSESSNRRPIASKKTKSNHRKKQKCRLEQSNYWITNHLVEPSTRRLEQKNNRIIEKYATIDWNNRIIDFTNHLVEPPSYGLEPKKQSNHRKIHKYRLEQSKSWLTNHRIMASSRTASPLPKTTARVLRMTPRDTTYRHGTVPSWVVDGCVRFWYGSNMWLSMALPLFRVDRWRASKWRSTKPGLSSPACFTSSQEVRRRRLFKNDS